MRLPAQWTRAIPHRVLDGWVTFPTCRGFFRILVAPRFGPLARTCGTQQNTALRFLTPTSPSDTTACSRHGLDFDAAGAQRMVGAHEPELETEVVIRPLPLNPDDRTEAADLLASMTKVVTRASSRDTIMV